MNKNELVKQIREYFCDCGHCDACSYFRQYNIIINDLECEIEDYKNKLKLIQKIAQGETK